MNSLVKIWNDLQEKETDVQVLNYWEDRHNRILDHLKRAHSDFDLAAKIMHKLAKSLNNRAQYSYIYYLYKAGYLPIENKLTEKLEVLAELKYELGRGLHHNRKYSHSKRLFNELAASDFDTRRIKGWWNQTVYASVREKFWYKVSLLPAIIKFGFTSAYVITVLNTNELLITTTLYIILSECYEAWWYQYKVKNYLKDYEGDPEIVNIKKKIKNRIIIALGISLLFYPIYFLNWEKLNFLVLIVVLYFYGFHYGLNYYYLPKLIVELNRKNIHNAQKNKDG